MNDQGSHIVKTTTWSPGPGCHTCQVAFAQEHGWPAGMGGIRVNEIVQKLPKGKYYLTYLPFPTELCILCRPRTKKGLEPACV